MMQIKVSILQKEYSRTLRNETCPVIILAVWMLRFRVKPSRMSNMDDHSPILYFSVSPPYHFQEGVC